MATIRKRTCKLASGEARAARVVRYPAGDAQWRLKTVKATKAGDAQRRGLIGHNPAGPVHVVARGRDKARLTVGVDIPSPDDVQRILAAAPRRYRALLVVSVFAGLRASELRGLRWSDVDLDARV